VQAVATDETPDPEPPLLQEGRTCWRVARASRAAFLVDGAAYFPALAAALERAEHQVLLLGWDFHGRVRLRRRRARAPDDELLGLLGKALAARPSLHVYALGWGLGSLLAFGRESLPRLHLGLHGLPRLDFRLDRCHPWLACHHQKVIAIDDRVAFAGGFDVTAYRWDSREHRPDDPRRVTPEGVPYGPFHDLQLAVEGDAAAALGELARERWQRATGERLAPPPAGSSPWPPSLQAALTDVPVGVARTDPGFGGRPPAREVEALYAAAFAAAQRWIYVENQYLTSERAVECLAARLREESGPEVVLVVPASCPAWLEEASMGRLRARALARLRAADRHGRLRTYAPRVAADLYVNVHAKVLIVDDALVRIGSSNLSNRSLSLDTECDLAIEAGGRADVTAAIAALRDGLVAEHLGVTAPEVRERLRAGGSLIRVVEELGQGERTLAPVPDCDPPGRLAAATAARFFDPRGPARACAEGSAPRPDARRTARLGVGVALAVLGLGVALLVSLS
jgi:phosphatidylserine/phosphatidylglycerophosphate/cardiolipin synthase-like enzyme